MTNRDFVNHIIDIYQTAKVVKLPFENDHSGVIRRGRSHTISGLTEDLFAYFLKTNFQQIDKIVIDQPTSFRISEASKPKTIHPDISLIIDGEVAAMFDLKMDLGRNRDKIENIYTNAKKDVKDLRGNTVWYKDGITKELFGAKVSQDLKYFIVVISNKNITSTLLEQGLACVQNETDNGLVEYYFLTSSRHPNSGSSERTKQQIILLPDFERLMQEISDILPKRGSATDNG